jgi:hypothetical protein
MEDWVYGMRRKMRLYQSTKTPKGRGYVGKKEHGSVKLLPAVVFALPGAPLQLTVALTDLQ